MKKTGVDLTRKLFYDFLNSDSDFKKRCSVEDVYNLWKFFDYGFSAGMMYYSIQVSDAMSVNSVKEVLDEKDKN